jgi:hypothetical protein
MPDLAHDDAQASVLCLKGKPPVLIMRLDGLQRGTTCWRYQAVNPWPRPSGQAPNKMPLA